MTVDATRVTDMMTFYVLSVLAQSTDAVALQYCICYLTCDISGIAKSLETNVIPELPLHAAKMERAGRA